MCGWVWEFIGNDTSQERTEWEKISYRHLSERGEKKSPVFKKICLSVEVMEAVVWRCSSGGPWRSSGGARREVRGGRLEALAAGGGKAGSRAAQRMQNGETRNRTAAHFF